MDVAAGTAVAIDSVLPVTFDLPSGGSGDRDGQVVILTNSLHPDFKTIVLKLTATVRPRVWSEPRRVRLTSAQDDVSPSTTLRVHALNAEVLSRFTEATSLRGHVDTTLRFVGADEIVLDVKVAASTTGKAAHDYIAISFDDTSFPRLIVDVQIDGDGTSDDVATETAVVHLPNGNNK